MDIHSLFLILHIVGVAFGAGGAFTSDFLFLGSIRDKKLNKTELHLIHIAGRVVWLGVAILVVSGAALLWLDTFSLLSSAAFQAKMSIVALIILNGIAFHAIHLPFLAKYFGEENDYSIDEEKAQKKLSFVAVSGAISSVSWLSALALGYLRVLPYSYLMIMAVYALLLAGAIGIALLAKRYKFPSKNKLKKQNNMSNNNTGANWKIILYVTAIVLVAVSLLSFTGRSDNLNNRADTSFELTPKSELKSAEASEVHATYAPDVPPPITRPDQRIFEVHLEVLENVCEIDPKKGVSFETWGYRIAGDTEVNCGAPGPVLRGRVGDMVKITLTNLAENKEHHDIDFHAATGPGGGAKALSVAPGETATIEARLLYPGVFMYHCAHEDPPKHIAHGMYGMFIVDPETPLPEADHEWAVMQSEWYVSEANQNGIAELDNEAVLSENPKYITFNGTTTSLVGDNALQMDTGEQARIYFVNQGLNLSSNFHPIGSHWDVVYPEGATHETNNVIHGSQSTLVVAGGGSVAEIKAQVPGNIVLVDHALSRAFYKGALGIIEVNGVQNEEIFKGFPASSEHEDDGHDHEDGEEHDVDAKEFTLEAGNYYYSQKELRVHKGDTVRITLKNAQGFHDLVLDEFDISTERLQEGEEQTIEFIADKKGEFEYYCSVGRHRELGQWGTLIVE